MRDWTNKEERVEAGSCINTNSCWGRPRSDEPSFSSSDGQCMTAPAAIAPLDASDVALAKEMNELSVQEREKILDDIHGVSPVPEETPEFVANCLNDMDVALTKVPKSKRKALDRALFLKPSILTDMKFKLMFLRSELYDPAKAALRMAKHYEEKLLYFGEGKLTKKITLDDLEEEDRKILNYCGCVVLPHSDSSGRPIWFFDVPRFDFDDPNQLIRCFWYIAEATVEDEMAQLRGVCAVAYCPGDRLAVPASIPIVLKFLTRAGEFDQGFPSRMSGFQICYNHSGVKYIVSKIGMVLGKQVRLRIRTHFGSDQEMQYSLMTFGIKCDYLFRSAKEDNRREIQEGFIKRRREIERIQKEKRVEEESKTGIILCPLPNDVLVGRGRPYQDFPGNRRLLSLVEEKYDKYQQTTSRFEKTCFFMGIVNAVHDSNGRYLEKITDGWKVASDKVAREKTAGAFRFKTFRLAEGATKSSGADTTDRSTKRTRYGK